MNISELLAAPVAVLFEHPPTDEDDDPEDTPVFVESEWKPDEKTVQEAMADFEAGRFRTL